jgi:hypothetical protein
VVGGGGGKKARAYEKRAVARTRDSWLGGRAAPSLIRAARKFLSLDTFFFDY